MENPHFTSTAGWMAYYPEAVYSGDHQHPAQCPTHTPGCTWLVKPRLLSPFLLTKLINWVCTTFPSCPSLAVTLVSIPELDATFGF